MLILVGVTINVALNGGLFTKASDASKQMQVEADRETLLSAVVAAIGNDGKVVLEDIELPTGWEESNGTYTSPKGNSFTVDENGKIENKKDSDNDEPETPDEPVIQNPTLTAVQIDKGKYSEQNVASIKLVPTFYSDEQRLDAITQAIGLDGVEALEETGYASLSELLCYVYKARSLNDFTTYVFMNDATYNVKKPDTEELFTCVGGTLNGTTITSATEGIGDEGGCEVDDEGEFFYFYIGSGLGTYEFTITLGDYVLTASTTVEEY